MGNPAGSGPSNQHRSGRRVRLADLIAAFLLLAIVNVAGGPAGFWSADEAVSHQQVELLATGTWTAEPPEPQIDPTGRWHPLSPISLGDGAVAPYSKHPLFPAVVRVGDLAGGRIGRHLVPAAGSVLAALLIAIGSDRRRPGSARLAFWLALGATPLLFHGTILWAHSLGVAAAAGASLLVQSLLGQGPGHRRRLRFPSLVGGLILASVAGVLLRSEAAIFSTLLGGSLTVVGLVSRERRLIGAGAATAAATVLAYRLEAVLRAEILGPGGDVALAPPPEALFDWSVRASLAWTWLVDGRPDLSLARFVGALLLAVAAWALRPDSRLELSPRLALLGGLFYLPAMAAGSTMSFFPSAPALLVGLILLPSLDRFARLVIGLTTLTFGAVVATSYANGGGGDWGGRYLAMLLAPVAIIALPEVWQLGRTVAEQSKPRLIDFLAHGGGPVLFGTLLASAALAASMSIDAVDTRRTTGVLARELATEIEMVAQPDDLVVITDSRIGRLLGDTDVEARLLQVPAADMHQLISQLAETEPFLILDLLAPFEPPDNWTVTEVSDRLVRVQPEAESSGSGSPEAGGGP